MPAEVITPSAATTLAALDTYILQRMDVIMRSSYLLKGLESHGRIVNNCGGKRFKWFPRYRRYELTAGPGNPNNISFIQKNLRKEASLPYRSYWMGTKIDKIDRLMQQSGGSDVKPVALWNIAQELLDIMLDDARESFRYELFVDGSATGNERRIHGFESWFGVSGTQTNLPVASPSDTYAGLVTTLGNYGGSVTGTWPQSTAIDPEYDFWSPLVVYYDSTIFDGASANWNDQWQQAVNYCISHMETIRDMTVDVILLNPELYRLARDSLKSIQQVQVYDYKETTNIGHPVLQYMGTELAKEFGVPANVGYGFSWNDLQIRNMQKQMFFIDRDHDITTGADVLALDAFLNLRCTSPARTFKLTSGAST